MKFINKINLFDKKVSFNVLSLFIINILRFSINIITLPHLIKSYGVENWGEIVFAQIIINYLIWLIDWSFNLHSSKLISVNEGYIDKQNEIFSLTLNSQFFLLIISMIFINSYGIIFAKIKDLYYYSNLIIVGSFLQPYWYLNGRERIYESSIFQLLNKSFFAILILSTINTNSLIQDYFLIMGKSYLLTGVLFIIRLKYVYKIKLEFKNHILIFKFLRSSFKLYISEIWSTLSDSFVVIIIGNTLGNIELGIYNIAERIKSILVQTIHPITHSIFPRMSKKYNLNKREGNLSLISFLKFGLFMISLLFLISNLFSSQIVIYFSTEFSSEIIPIFRILLFSFVLNVITEIFISQYFVPNNMYNFINNIKIIKFFIYLVFTSIGLLTFRLEGAAIACVISEAISLSIIINKFQITKNHELISR